MSEDTRTDYNLYESIRGSEAADYSAGNHEFSKLPVELLIKGGAGNTIVKFHLVDDPPNRYVTIGVAANVEMRRPYRADIIHADTTAASVIGMH